MAFIAPLAVLLAGLAAFVHIQGGLAPACTAVRASPLWMAAAGCLGPLSRALSADGGSNYEGGGWPPRAPQQEPAGGGAAGTIRGLLRGRQQPLVTRWKAMVKNALWPGPPPTSRLGGCPSLGRALFAAMLIITWVWALAWFIWAFCRPQVKQTRHLRQSLITSVVLLHDVESIATSLLPILRSCLASCGMSGPGLAVPTPSRWTGSLASSPSSSCLTRPGC